MYLHLLMSRLFRLYSKINALSFTCVSPYKIIISCASEYRISFISITLTCAPSGYCDLLNTSHILTDQILLSGQYLRVKTFFLLDKVFKVFRLWYLFVAFV